MIFCSGKDERIQLVHKGVNLNCHLISQRIIQRLIKPQQQQIIAWAPTHASNGIFFEKLKCIYFPLPKVACTSIRMTLAATIGFKRGDIQKYPMPRVFLQDNDFYGDYTKFCFVRSPWEKLVSCYCDKICPTSDVDKRGFQQGVFIPFLKFGFVAGMSFAEFVEIIHSIPDEYSDEHFRSQYTFVTNKEGELLVNHIGRFENLETDFFMLMKKLGREDIQLRKINQSMHREYHTYYSDKTAQMVADRYRRDIEIFGYSF